MACNRVIFTFTHIRIYDASKFQRLFNEIWDPLRLKSHQHSNLSYVTTTALSVQHTMTHTFTLRDCFNSANVTEDEQSNSVNHSSYLYLTTV
jgi:hypothetical protein